MAEPKKMGRPKREGPKMPNALSIRGSLEWREWLARVAKQQRVTPTQAIDLALVEWAKRAKLDPPPRRV